ncbi:hypothetical protein HYH03_016797 [Edaphochlamys debaryana]|uniref:C3H1-type domain-containing protein n=1 Tax=Edaphochlamys debaryana TaxID=47281 RepID=A0A835XIE6_9CHLO|nr:hypothetical protein HYH03_016797 [Edaphochlamys debaryana]|eukprot:KAG2484381.1 hypothetical protein HYH03_016797 [Edaphochlamys debaryana]
MATPERPTWLTCKVPGKPCAHCNLEVAVGSLIWPAEPSGYLHAACAHALVAEGLLQLVPPTCKHLAARGFCLLGSRCFYTHPPQPPPLPAGGLQATAPGSAHGLEAVSSGVAAAALPASAAAVAAVAPLVAAGRRKLSNAEAARLNRGAGRRSKVRNRWRVSAFRGWLLDTFGLERLCQGSGVLDVAGGKGELAFELLNLNGVPSTLLDPRPMQLDRYVKLMQAGVYERSRAFEVYNSMRGASVVTAALDAEDGGTLGGREPVHLKMFLTDQVVAFLGRLATLRRSGLEGGADWAMAMEDSMQALLSSQRRAAEVAWTRKGLQSLDRHEDGGGDSTDSMTPGSSRRGEAIGHRWRRRRQKASNPDDTSSEEPGSADPDPGLEATQPTQIGQGAGGRTGEVSDVGRDLPGVTEHDVGRSDGSVEGTAAAPSGGSDCQEGRRWAVSAVQTLLSCSVVAAMHPDQAAEPAARLALALGVPFAIVPCCVYATEFPARKLADGQQVRSYEQLCQFLAELGGEGVATLPFEGKNQLIYRLPSSTAVRAGSRSRAALSVVNVATGCARTQPQYLPQQPTQQRQADLPRPRRLDEASSAAQPRPASLDSRIADRLSSLARSQDVVAGVIGVGLLSAVTLCVASLPPVELAASSVAILPPHEFGPADFPDICFGPDRPVWALMLNSQEPSVSADAEAQRATQYALASAIRPSHLLHLSRVLCADAVDWVAGEARGAAEEAAEAVQGTLGAAYGTYKRWTEETPVISSSMLGELSTIGTTMARWCVVKAFLAGQLLLPAFGMSAILSLTEVEGESGASAPMSHNGCPVTAMAQELAAAAVISAAVIAMAGDRPSFGFVAGLAVAMVDAAVHHASVGSTPALQPLPEQRFPKLPGSSPHPFGLGASACVGGVCVEVCSRPLQ